MISKKRGRAWFCATYVFAPACRGVAAKRSMEQSADIDNVISSPTALDEAILRSIRDYQRNKAALLPQELMLLLQQSADEQSILKRR